LLIRGFSWGPRESILAKDIGFAEKEVRVFNDWGESIGH
jgi:hypothetical protein